jgi:hypothetical protein
MAANKFLSDRGRDHTAELNRLLAAANRYGDRAASDSPFHQETSSKGPDETAAPDDGEALGAHNLHWASHKEHQAEVPGVRRRGLAIIAMTGLALLGTAGAFGYREIFRGSLVATPPPPIIRASSEPNKFAPVSSEHQAKNGGNARQDRADTTGSIEKLVSREEQPKTIEPPKRAPRRSSPRAGALTSPAGGQPVPYQLMPHVMAAWDASGPPPNPVASQRGGQSSAADDRAAANREHLAAPAAANTPPVAAAVSGSSYAVQVTSERTEAAAQVAFRTLQAKYPEQLGGRQPLIRRADLGAAGIYYRALVGPLTSATEATRLCSKLKAAGADCIIQKN